MFFFLCLTFANGILAEGVISDTAVDISHWQETVDFDQVVKSGIKVVIHKATQGITYVDPTYVKRSRAAKAAGLEYWGAYHFADGSDGKRQAEHFLDLARHADFHAVDLEPNGNNTVGLQQAEDIVKSLIRETGRLPLVYGGAYFLDTFNQSDVLSQCPLWVASWRGGQPTLPKMWTDWVLWQHTDGSSGSPPYEVPGIGNCDRDRVNERKFLQYVNKGGHSSFSFLKFTNNIFLIN